MSRIRLRKHTPITAEPPLPKATAPLPPPIGLPDGARHDECRHWERADDHLGSCTSDSLPCPAGEIVTACSSFESKRCGLCRFRHPVVGWCARHGNWTPMDHGSTCDDYRPKV